jgi:hypothetical protein
MIEEKRKALTLLLIGSAVLCTTLMAQSAPKNSSDSTHASKKSHTPSVSLIEDNSSRQLPVEKTQLAQTKTKPTSMSSLASDAALQVGINTATTEAMSHVRSGMGGSTLGQAGSIFSGVMSHRQPKQTYVWAISNPASANVAKSDSPSLTVNFSVVPGVDPEEFEPALVKLTPSQSGMRLVGATQGKEDAMSSSAADWTIYSGFLEERVKLQTQKLGPGAYRISPASPLLPGEYGVVLRPVSKSKKFAGSDIARYQGDGMMFDSVWSFQIAADDQ